VFSRGDDSEIENLDRLGTGGGRGVVVGQGLYPWTHKIETSAGKGEVYYWKPIDPWISLLDGEQIPGSSSSKLSRTLAKERGPMYLVLMENPSFDIEAMKRRSGKKAV